MAYRQMRDGLSGAVLTGAIVRASDGAHIPADPANRDWRAYLDWCAAGNAPDGPEPAAAARGTVTGDQWAIAAHDLGLARALLDAVAAAKPSDRHRYGLIARDTALSADDPLLARICAGSAVDVAAVFARAAVLFPA